MAHDLEGRRIAILAADGVEQVELTEPRRALEEAGARVDLVSLRAGEIRAMRHMDRGDAFRVDRTVEEASAADYDALVLPGGVANPDILRADARAVGFARAFFEAGKPVGAICHGPWVLIEAGVVRGRTLTSWPSLGTDIRNAGGAWVDEEVHADRGLVTSRKPDDLPAFCRKIVEELAGGPHAGGVAYDEVVEESFPASDPPSAASTSTIGPPRRREPRG